MQSARWFDDLGAVLTPAQRTLVGGMLRSHELGGRVGIVVCSQWHEAIAALRADERDGGWWDFEEEERERLWTLAARAHTEGQLLAATGQAIADRQQAIADAVQRAAARLGVADPAWAREANSAALLAVHHRALARLAAAPKGHPFECKYRLFVEGRWPLGLVAGRFLVC